MYVQRNGVRRSKQIIQWHLADLVITDRLQISGYHTHSKGMREATDHATESAVPDDPEHAAHQLVPTYETGLPATRCDMLQRLSQISIACQNQQPRQFRRCLYLIQEGVVILDGNNLDAAALRLYNRDVARARTRGANHSQASA